MGKPTTHLAIDPEALAQAVATELPEEALSELVETFSALADGTRARILYALTQRPLCVRDLAILVGVSASAVSPPVAADQAKPSRLAPARQPAPARPAWRAARTMLPRSTLALACTRP